jgi:hypothetical protein
MHLASDCNADEIIVLYVSVGAVSYFPVLFWCPQGGMGSFIPYSVELCSTCAGCITSFIYDITVNFVSEMLFKIIVYINHCLPVTSLYNFTSSASLHIYYFHLLHEYKGQQTSHSTSSLGSHMKTQHYPKVACN